MSGPMLQALLEDRFELKIHRESREVPTYALNVARSAKPQPSKEGGCVPRTESQTTAHAGLEAFVRYRRDRGKSAKAIQP
jgi:uncharacterized protein (TIGR03435 family)